MPLIYLNCPEDTFTQEATDALADEMTTFALKVEGLPLTPFMRSTAWIYVNEYKPRLVYHGGTSDGTKVISLELNAFEFGLDDAAKATLISGITALIRKHAGIGEGDLVPVYVVFRNVPPSHFGVFGRTICWTSCVTRPPTPGRCSGASPLPAGYRRWRRQRRSHQASENWSPSIAAVGY